MRTGTRIQTFAILLPTLAISIGAGASAPQPRTGIDLSGLPVEEAPDATARAFTVSARVLKVTPIISRTQISEPVETCRLVSTSRHNDYRRSRRHIEPPHRVLRSVIGSLIGGAIGNQVGGGRGRKAATVAGALAGAHIATRGSRDAYRDQYDYRDNGNREVVEQCTQTSRIRHIEHIDGYRVRYRYNGQPFHKTMDHDPGEELQLTARVSPRTQSYDPQ